MGRLTIDLSGEQHQQVKAIAAMQGKSIREYVIERIFPATDSEDQAWEDLKSLLNSRITEAETKGVSEKTVEDIMKKTLRDFFDEMSDRELRDVAELRAEAQETRRQVLAGEVGLIDGEAAFKKLAKKHGLDD